jgi:hypothetical protein
VHQDEDVPGEGTCVRVRETKVEDRPSALDLLVDEHERLDAQALRQQFSVVRRVAEEQF